MGRAIATKEELLIFRDYGFSESISIFVRFGNGLAIVQWLACPVVDAEQKMVGGDGARDCWAQ